MSDDRDQLQAVEGTVIVHISFSVKQDPELSKEFVKLIKVGIFLFASYHNFSSYHQGFNKFIAQKFNVCLQK